MSQIITDVERTEALQRQLDMWHRAAEERATELNRTRDENKQLKDMVTQQAAIIDALLPEGSRGCGCSPRGGHLITCTYVRASASAIEQAERHRHLMKTRETTS